MPTRCLVWQQWTMCQKYLSAHRSVTVTGATQPGEKEDLGAILPSYEIVVMTPQVLVDALQVRKEAFWAILQRYDIEAMTLCSERRPWGHITRL